MASTTSIQREEEKNRRISYSSWSSSISPEKEDDFNLLSTTKHSPHKKREGSLSSALSDISSSSSCFGPPPPEKNENLTVIVKNKKRKRDKEKRRSRTHRSKRERKRHKLFDHKYAETPGTENCSRSKEIFASGDNILVSVCFDKKKDDEKTKKKKKNKKKKKKGRKDRYKEEEEHKEEIEPKIRRVHKEPVVKKSRKKTNLKPVAIIDLERSPKARDTTPKDVIILSEEDDEIVFKKGKVGPKRINPDEKHEVSSSIILPQEIEKKIGPPKSSTDKGPKKVDSSINMSSTTMSQNSSPKFTTESYDEDLLDIHATTPLDTLSPSPVKTSAQKKSYGRPANLLHPPTTCAGTALTKKPSNNTIVLEDTDDGSISPYSPNSSDYDDLFEPPKLTTSVELTEANLKKVFGNEKDSLCGALRRNYKRAMLERQRHRCPAPPPQALTPMDDDTLFDDIPNSAVDMQVKDKFVKKMHRQERVVDEVKLFLKPHFNKKTLTKDEYKDILRRAVPKICHSRSGEINPLKIQALCNAYVSKAISKRKLAMKSTSGNAIVSSTTTSIS